MLSTTSIGRIAVLFDGDNANPMYIPKIMELVGRMGNIRICKVYANWSRTSPAKWLMHSLIHQIKPEQVFNYLKGKNSTDFALMGDALEMAFKQEMDALCIVSSDSDFTDVVMRMRKYNVKTIVVGKTKSPMSLVATCNYFIDESTLTGDEKVAIRINDDDAQPVLIKPKVAAVKKETVVVVAEPKLKPLRKRHLRKFRKEWGKR